MKNNQLAWNNFLVDFMRGKKPSDKLIRQAKTKFKKIEKSLAKWK